MPPVYPTPAEKIRIIRTRERWTAYQFADHVGLGGQSLLSYENGNRLPPPEVEAKLLEIILAYETKGRVGVETFTQPKIKSKN